MYDCLIIGGGPCGVACAIYLKQAGYNIAIVENELIGGQPSLTSNITNVVGFIGTGRDFCNILNQQIIDNNIEVIYGEAELKENNIYVDKQLIKSKAIVIATGSSPNKLKGFDNAHYCALCDGPLYKDKNVIVIGSGNSAYTEAIHLSKICKNVELLQDIKYPVLANNDLQKEVNSISNIQVINYEEIENSMDKYVTLKLGDHKHLLNYDGVFVSIGRTPNIQWINNIKSLEVNPNYNIVVSKKVINNIFAGGDIINKSIKQISTAINDGVVISQNVIKYLKENNE